MLIGKILEKCSFAAVYVSYVSADPLCSKDLALQ